jgi:hypothetical protein
MDAAQIKHMVDRFLGWRLPENFAPDGGVSYTPPSYAAQVGMPTGTNLFSATEAEAMVRHMVEGLPDASVHHVVLTDRQMKLARQAIEVPFADDDHPAFDDNRDEALAEVGRLAEAFGIPHPTTAR